MICGLFCFLKYAKTFKYSQLNGERFGEQILLQKSAH